MTYYYHTPMSTFVAQRTSLTVWGAFKMKDKCGIVYGKHKHIRFIRHHKYIKLTFEIMQMPFVSSIFPQWGTSYSGN